ncbi:MAG: hypothetical protein IJO33_02190 [Bacilli bacterium]|nr:hypothetical protein [Bacilli bacterium]
MKKKNNLFFKVLSLLFFLFIALYIALESGYYETKIEKEVTLTNEKIKAFEEDVKNNEVINLDSYLEKKEVDYSNSISRFGNKLTNSLAKTLTKGLSGVFDIVKTLFW